jgi:hypothetical protein
MDVRAAAREVGFGIGKDYAPAPVRAMVIEGQTRTQVIHIR